MSEPTPTSPGRSALRWLGRLLALVILGYLVFRVAEDREKLADGGLRLAPGWLAAALAVYLGNQLASSAIWAWMIGRFGPAPRLRDAVGVCGRAWLGRYLPGKLWVVGGKVVLGAKLGIPTRTLAVVSITELALIILVVTTMGSGCLLAVSAMGVPALPGLPLAAALLCGIVAIAPPVFRRLLNLVARVTRRRPLEADEVLSVRSLLGTAARMLTLSLVGAFFWYCLLRALLTPEQVTTELVLLTIGGGSVASIAGMIAVFAPAGIGVRDGTQAAFLTLLLPDPVAIAVVLAARLAVVAGDVAYFGLSVAATRRRGGPSAPPPPPPGEART
ncbi:MAG: hypothetical protein ABFS86_09155 [Planctomycetota bacterium]